MKRIKIFSDFCNSHELKLLYEKICETHKLNNYGIDKEVFLTSEDDYTHAIIINTITPTLKSNIPKENVVGFGMEPIPFLRLTNHFINYAKQYIHKYYIGDVSGEFLNVLLPEPFVEKYSFMFHNKPLEYKCNKTKLMSIVISHKNFSPGHNYRHELVKKILQTNLPIDIYGNGCKFYEHLNDARIKGSFKELEPYENYKYHVCIENFQTNHYFSEKIINPLLCETIPVYLGCKNIDLYFNDMYINLTGNAMDDMKLLENILLNPLQYEKNMNVEYVKLKVNLIKNLNDIFTETTETKVSVRLPFTDTET